MSSTSYQANLRASLIDLFTSAASPEKFLLERDVVAAGVPSRHATGITRQSKVITSEAEAVIAADEWAAHIASTRQSIDSDKPADLAASIPRL